MKNRCINGHFLTQKLTGIQRFSYEITKALIIQDSSIVILSPRKVLNDYQLEGKIIKFGFFSGLIWEQIELPIYLLFHHRPFLLNFGSPGPLFYRNRLVTVHDITFKVHPEWFSWIYSTYYRFITPIYTRFSRKIITVSDFSKRELQNWLKIPNSKIEIVHNAVSKSIVNSLNSTLNKEEKYILTVASIDPRKNMFRLIEAFKLIEKTINVKLIIVGRSSKLFNIKITEDIRSKSIGYVTDKELAFLYQNAECFVYPSLYEGFGIPPLEAMSFNCPVVLSNIPVFNEIYGDAACYIDPYSVESIKNGIERILTDIHYKNKLIQNGIEKSKQYSWEKSAEKLYSIIETL